ELVGHGDHDGLKVGVFGKERDLAAGSREALDGEVVANSGNNDLAVTGVGRFLDGEQIAIEDAGVAHAEAAHAQQVVGGLAEKRSFDADFAFDMFGREYGVAGGDTPD